MKPGQSVRYLVASDEQIRWGGNDDPRSLLTPGTLYTVGRVDVRSWHTKLELVGYPDLWFNSASFTEEETPCDDGP